MADQQVQPTTKERLAKVISDGKITAEPVKLTATEEAAKKLYGEYDKHLTDLKTKIDGYSVDVKNAVSTKLKAEIEAYEAEKKKLLSPVSPELEQALGVISKWSKIFDSKTAPYDNAKTTFANAKEHGLTLDDRKEYESAIVVVAKYLGVKDLNNIVADGKNTSLEEKADFEKIQAELIKRGFLSGADNLDKYGRKKPDGKPDAQDGAPGGATTAKLLLAVQKQSLDEVRALGAALEGRLSQLESNLTNAIAAVPKPETKKPEVVTQAERAVDAGIQTDTKNEQQKLKRVIDAGNEYREKLIFELYKEIADRNERNVAVLALYQDKRIDFKAVKAGNASKRDIHKLVEVLAGIEGRHKDYDQNAKGESEKSYRANVKAAKKEIEAKLANIDDADKKNGSKTDKAQFLLSEAAKRLDELLTVKNDDMVYSSKKKVFDFGKEPDLIYDSKAATLLADKLRYDTLFELFGLGKDESKKAK